MRKIFFYAFIFTSISALTLLSCTKNQEIIEHHNNVVTANTLANDPVFIKLNNATNRFDPKYLQIVLKDQSSTEDIISASLAIIEKLKSNPENISEKEKIIQLYGLSSIDELNYLSYTIANSLNVLSKKYYGASNSLSQSDNIIFFEARKIYLRNRIAEINNDALRKRTSGLWSDMVDNYLSEFNYLGYAYDETLIDAGDGGGGCNESCCYEREACYINARTKYTGNLWSMGLGGALSVGGAGTVAGSWFPIVGNITGGIGGFFVGGFMGATLANDMYRLDLKACDATYKACLEKRKGINF